MFSYNKTVVIRNLILIIICIASFLVFNNFNKNIKTTEEVKGFKHAEWSNNAVIYEVNVRQYTPEGTFKAFEEHLLRLKNMGVKILWLMPIQPIGEVNRKGSLGSYYSVKDYLAVNPEFGTSEDFRHLVTKIHQLGMYVIIDWVANHTSWDHAWATSNPDFYSKDSSGNFIPPVADWHDVIDLNYENKGLREKMISALKFWIDRYDIDGYRCDVAGMVPTDFWNEARPQLDKLKPVFMLAEAEQLDLHQKAFDMTYAWDLHRLYNDIAKGKKNVEDLVDYTEKEQTTYKNNEYRMNFVSNHDENTWNGTEFERLGKAVKTFTALNYVYRGMPLIYSGQESENLKRLRFFDKDTIEWKKTQLSVLYEKLGALKINNQALWNGNFGSDIIVLPVNNKKSIFAFVRMKDKNKVFCVFNLSNKQITANIESDLLDGQFTNFATGKEQAFNNSSVLKLKPWGYYIFYN
ncbi:MAG: alpha-amylase family glycosyl hydrolase [bacterium]